MTALKFIANHTIIVGKGTAAKTLKAGEALPKMPVEELMRLQDLGAISGSDGLRDGGPTVQEFVRAGYDPSNYPPEGFRSVSSDGDVDAAVAAFKAAAGKAATDQASAANAAKS